MYKQCRTEQSAARQRELEQGLLEAMEEQLFADISVSDLCDRMGIPRKSFYRYFSSKEGALSALLDHTLLDFENGSRDVFFGSQGLEKTLEWFFRFWKEQKRLLDALERSGLSGHLVLRAIEYAKMTSGTPLRFMLREEKLAREYGTSFMVCGLMSMVLQWHHDGYAESAHVMATVAVRLLTQPLFPDAQKLL